LPISAHKPSLAGLHLPCGAASCARRDPLDEKRRSTPFAGQLLRSRLFAPPATGWNRKLMHLRDRVPVNAKPLRRFPAAQPVNHHRMSDLGIKFHCEHPSSPSMPISGIETA
jgi:hypothetical protein